MPAQSSLCFPPGSRRCRSRAAGRCSLPAAWEAPHPAPGGPVQPLPGCCCVPLNKPDNRHPAGTPKPFPGDTPGHAQAVRRRSCRGTAGLPARASAARRACRAAGRPSPPRSFPVRETARRRTSTPPDLVAADLLVGVRAREHVLQVSLLRHVEFFCERALHLFGQLLVVGFFSQLLGKRRHDRKGVVPVSVDLHRLAVAGRRQDAVHTHIHPGHLVQSLTGGDEPSASIRMPWWVPFR